MPEIYPYFLILINYRKCNNCKRENFLKISSKQHVINISGAHDFFLHSSKSLFFAKKGFQLINCNFQFKKHNNDQI